MMLVETLERNIGMIHIIHMCVHICTCIDMCVYIYVYRYMYIDVDIYLFIRLFIDLQVSEVNLRYLSNLFSRPGACCEAGFRLFEAMGASLQSAQLCTCRSGLRQANPQDVLPAYQYLSVVWLDF